MSEDFTVSILANDINRDCTGQYHFRNKISKSDQKEKDEADSRLAPKFHPATTRPRLGVVPSLRGETYRTWPIRYIGLWGSRRYGFEPPFTTWVECEGVWAIASQTSFIWGRQQAREK